MSPVLRRTEQTLACAMHSCCKDRFPPGCLCPCAQFLSCSRSSQPKRKRASGTQFSRFIANIKLIPVGMNDPPASGSQIFCLPWGPFALTCFFAGKTDNQDFTVYTTELAKRGPGHFSLFPQTYTYFKITSSSGRERKIQAD